jgi:hypothetical protein
VKPTTRSIRSLHNGVLVFTSQFDVQVLTRHVMIQQFVAVAVAVAAVLMLLVTAHEKRTKT